MHELSIAASIVESVLEFVTARQIECVRAVRLAVGELTCVQHDQLRFCYESLAGQTQIGGSSLEIELVPAEVRCPHCQYEGAPRYWDEALAGDLVPTLQCPNCGKATEAVRGHECAIRSIQCTERRSPDPQRDPSAAREDDVSDPCVRSDVAAAEASRALERESPHPQQCPK